jgi:UDP-N-acetylglucosamine 4-epimerase
MYNFNFGQKFLVTGCAGFIGSNILEYLLKNNQVVVGLDNFATGYMYNLNEVKNSVSSEQWDNFTFIEGDIRNYDTCILATETVDVVIHQAALGSVPRSINDPQTTHSVNVDGFFNILNSARQNKINRIVYASSSSVYGDNQDLPKVESVIGNQLSPYAGTKYINEIYSKIFARTYGMEIIGLRYFNVFGQRQDPNGEYAAVIPLWFKALINNETLYINGDGSTSRDFCYIDNVVQANILAATTQNKKALNQIYNIACGSQTTLNQLYQYISELLQTDKITTPQFKEFRAGDVKHSLASIDLAQGLLNYVPKFNIYQGLVASSAWYKNFLTNR